jgi:electron transport complex protein RnfC
MTFLKRHLHGIKVEHYKNTMNHVTEVMPIPDTVYISMSQHIGAACIPLVSAGDRVTVGQKIGDSEAPVSAPVHSSVSGTVVSIDEFMSSLGTMDKTVVIKSDKKQTLDPALRAPVVETREEFVRAVRESGLVGLGGAAFPTHVKYNPRNFDQVKTLVINGAECEPYITSDYRTMMEDSQDIVDGIKIIMKYLNLDHCYIGIEDNKPEAIRKLTGLTDELPEISIVKLVSKYPKGAERVLIFETTGKVLPPGKLPADIGVIVSNITSAAFIGQYFKTGVPLIQKRITVDGSSVSNPKNILAPIGTQIYEIVDFCGGYKKAPKKIIMGGPMMGRSIYHDGKPLIKNNNAILAFDEEESFMEKETACINCGRCARVCPLNLMPTSIAKAYKYENLEGLKKLKVSICMECGCCAYVCPAKKQLSMINRLAKAKVKEAEQNGKL